MRRIPLLLYHMWSHLAEYVHQESGPDLLLRDQVRDPTHGRGAMHVCSLSVLCCLFEVWLV